MTIIYIIGTIKRLNNMKKAAYFQHVKTTNDTNGNPRRSFLVFDESMNLLSIIEEGYQGNSAMQAEFPNYHELKELYSINVQPKEYKRLTKGL